MAAQKYFVLNLLACEEKDYDKFVHGPQQPAGMTDKPTLNDLKKVLEEKGSKNVVLVQMNKSSGIYFVFADIDSVKAEENAPVFKGGASVPFLGTRTQAAGVESDKAPAIAAGASIRSMVISHCLDAFPLIKDELIKNGVKVNDSLFAEIAAANEEFTDASFVVDDAMENPDMEKATDAQNFVNEWCKKVFAFVKAIFSGVPDRKPDPVPPPEPVPGIVSVCVNCKVLGEELEKEKGKVSQLEERLKKAEDDKKKVEDENAGLKDKIEELNKIIEELKKNIPEPPKPRPEPTILNTTIEFQPKKFTKNGKEEILFFVMMGYYKHYYIAKDCADQLKLDKTKPVKLIIDSFATHCHTDEEEESKIAQEYYVPKGEDFFICRGKVAP